MNPSIDTARMEALVTTMSERMAALTRTLATWVQEAPHTLQEIEEHVRRIVQEVGATLVASLCALLTPAEPTRTVPCPCGQPAAYQRRRTATVTTILGPITFARPYYLCAACGHGQAPVDRQLQLCAGSRSAGLDELLALLGATQDSFAEASGVLERLSLVHVSPNTVRDATESLGAVLVAHQAAQATRAQAGHDLPAADPAPARLYITMDGVLAQLHERGWSEVKVGACFHTHTRPAPRRPEHMEVHAERLSYVATLAEAETFGWHLWQEAVRRGVCAAGEVVVLGDGAHWIWNLAALHFPGATQILDWYHATAYVWAAATAIWGAEAAKREAWARAQVEALWDGQVAQVLAELDQHRAAGEGVTAALSYYTTHQDRMHYAAYRARGLQIGSGSVESGCKQLVSARLKQAGMIWDAAGAEEVATVRAWLKSERWAEAMARRPAPARGYERQHAQPGAEAGQPVPTAAAVPAAPDRATPEARAEGGLPPAVLATIRAELAQEPGPHPWRKAWSVKRQREQNEANGPPARTALAA